jgi:hypothetical protein
MQQTDATKSDPRSRRAVLAAAAGAVAASAVATLGRPVPATAADGDPLTLGQDNQADTITRLDGTLGVTPILEVFNDVPVPNPISITAINGFSANGEGVLGTSEGSFGLASSGVRGVAAKRAGVGVSAFNVEGGLALHVSGKARLATRSGRATVSAGRASVDIDLRQKGGLSGMPLCFANLMSYRPGVFVTTVRPNYPVAGKARIYLNRTATADTFVAWFVLN